MSVSVSQGERLSVSVTLSVRLSHSVTPQQSVSLALRTNQLHMLDRFPNPPGRSELDQLVIRRETIDDAQAKGFLEGSETVRPGGGRLVYASLTEIVALSQGLTNSIRLEDSVCVCDLRS